MAQIQMQVEREFAVIYERCQSFTMVDLLKCHNLYQAVRYTSSSGVPGAYVECGVWRGGCGMLMALTLMTHHLAPRDIWLYDTFAGMTRPSDRDVCCKDGRPAIETWHEHEEPTHNAWCYASRTEVERNLGDTGYDPSRLHLVEGPVEETIPRRAPSEIAILRLDTDFYESTRHELEHLYPRLVPGGVLILDDYHYWTGQRAAAMEYFASRGIGIMLTCTSTSATGVKAPPYGVGRASAISALSASDSPNLQGAAGR